MTELRTAALALALAVATVGGCARQADEQPLQAMRADRPPVEDAPSDDAPDRTTTTARTPTTAAPTTTTTAPPAFRDGRLIVGTDVQPGRYVSDGAFCYWERRSGLSGAFEEIIVNGGGEGHTIVDILPGDVAFDSSGCGGWSVYAPPPAPVTAFGPGDWAVGDEIAPGTYRAEGGACAWERATGFTHDYDEILDYGFPTGGPVVVEIRAGDVRFSSTGCGDWTPA